MTPASNTQLYNPNGTPNLAASKVSFSKRWFNSRIPPTSIAFLLGLFRRPRKRQWDELESDSRKMLESMRSRLTQEERQEEGKNYNWNRAIENLMWLCRDLGCPSSKALNIPDLNLGVELGVMVLEMTEKFMKRVNDHPQDRLLSNHDKYRALTNLWAYVLVCFCVEVSCVELRDDIYALSLAYPYEDDLMDDPTMDTQMKQAFATNIGKALLGLQNGPPAPTTTRPLVEARLYELSEMIRQEHKHEDCGALASIIALNHAQRESLKQQHCKPAQEQAKENGQKQHPNGKGAGSLTKAQRNEIFQIVQRKGAATVVSGAYLAVHELNQAQFNFAALLGILGQFIKDLEDIGDDIQRGEATVASLSFQRHGTVDRFVSRALKVIQHFRTKHSRYFPSLNHDRFELVMTLIVLRLLSSTFSLPKTYYTPQFQSFVESHLGSTQITVVLLHLRKIETTIFEDRFDQPFEPKNLQGQVIQNIDLILRSLRPVIREPPKH